jgi:Fic family protein
VFIHPFGDGNGRIHRLLLHHVLAKRGYMPDGIVVPISSVLASDLRSYDEALEAFSTQVMRHSKYSLDADGELTILDTDVDIYRFLDLTVQAEATFTWLERAIVDELVHELEFLRSYDEALRRMREIIEMPDRKEQLFIKLCLGNRGSISARKRSKFAELDDTTVAALEAVVREAMGIEPI